MVPPANFGSDVGKGVGMRIWRVKDFALVEEPKQNWGSFYSGDSYLILDTFLADGRLRHHIHFWLGNETTMDEAGSVAIFAAQLDDSLGGGPIQFRQAQGTESSEFLKLFPRLRYRAGGYASGFKDTSANKGEGPVHLYQIKSPNKTCVQVFEVPCKLASLNHGDCFLLEDVGAKLLWVWHGSSANIREKMRAIEAGNAFKEGTGIKLNVLDDGDTISSESHAFFKRLGCDAPPEASAIKEPEADRPPPVLLAPPVLYKVEGSGFDQVSVDGAPITQSMLEQDGQYVLFAAGCTWVWTGPATSGADPPLQVGGRFTASRSLPPSAVVRAVKARFEPGLLTTYFADWGADGASQPGSNSGRDSFGNPIPGPGKGTDEQPYNAEEAAAAMVAAVTGAEGGGGASASAVSGRSLQTAYGKLTSSKIQVWVMTGTSSLELPRQEVGHFYDGAAYVVLHSYSTSANASDLRYAVYVWQGRRSSNIESGGAALMAADLHKSKYAGRCTLVRCEQHQEPAHFVRLFKGTMIVRRGPRPTNIAPGRSPPGTHLYQIKGEAVALAHAVEVDALSSSLSSGDCFVLELAAPIGAPAGSGAVMLWMGRGSSEGEKEVATAAAGVLATGGMEVQRIEEGSEKAAFWEPLGGRAGYDEMVAAAAAKGSGRPRGASIVAAVAAASPKLFHLRDCAGRGLKVETHSTFAQDTLDDDDCWLLDTGSELYVWYGKTCKPTERPRARDVGARYLAATDRADGGAATIEVESGQEPPFFTCHFAGWDTVDVNAERMRSLSVGSGKDAA